jgi:lipoyl-dependent peroxiredoxin
MSRPQAPHLPDTTQLARLMAWRGVWISMINTRVAAGQKSSHPIPAVPRTVLYAAEAVVQGGRDGLGRTSEGRLDVDLSVPEEMSGNGGPGTNPEQLFAVAYAASFQSALLGIARVRNLDASRSQITCQVGIGPTGNGGFGLTASLDLHAPNLTARQAADLMARAHEHCAYSAACRDNIEVTLTVDRMPLAQAGETAAESPATCDDGSPRRDGS